MKACRLLCYWCFGLILVPCFTYGQTDIHPTAYTYNEDGNTISSNVPLNEINSHAWRNFNRLFPRVTGGESWLYSPKGYQVSFMQNGLYYQAFFSEYGGYRYSLHHYAGKDIPREPGALLKRKFPDYQLNVVTEITDGERIVYLVRLVSPTKIVTATLCDGETEVIAEDSISDPAETASATSQRSYR